MNSSFCSACLCGLQRGRKEKASPHSACLVAMLHHAPERVYFSAQISWTTHSTRVSCIMNVCYRIHFMTEFHFNTMSFDCGQKQGRVSRSSSQKSCQGCEGQAGGSTSLWFLVPSPILAQQAQVPTFRRNSSLGPRGQNPPVGRSSFLYWNCFYCKEMNSHASTVKSWIFVQIFHRESSCFFLHLES